MLYKCCTFSFHQVSAPAAYLCICIMQMQLFNEITAMQIATCFSGNYIIFHIKISLAINYCTANYFFKVKMFSQGRT